MSTILSVNVCYAAPTSPTPKEVVKSCDKVISTKDKVIGSLKDVVEDQNKQLIKVTADRDAKEQEVKAWYRNPFLVGGIGALFYINPIVGGVGLLGAIILPKL